MENEVYNKVFKAIEEFFEKAAIERGGIFVLGCSTSEIAGGRIGKSSAPPLGVAVVKAALAALEGRGIYLAVQCCEHLNRALILEKEAARRHSLTEVMVRPVPEAGGSAAAAAWDLFRDAVAVREVSADGGMDIGATLIGMHLKRVAVPLRVSFDAVGHARIVLASTRPEYIGGPRAAY